MKIGKYLLAATLAVGMSLVHGQSVILDGSTKAAPTARATGMPAGKFFVNPDTLPKRGPSLSDINVVKSFTGPYASGNPDVTVPKRFAAPDTVGDFREACNFSHFGFDDPIVYPGEAGRTHLHAFFGNTLTGAASDPQNMATAGESTCAGGLLNRTGYWSPALIDERTGNAIKPLSVLAYYKNSLSGASSQQSYGGKPMQWFPRNLRMIAGNPNATSAPTPLTNNSIGGQIQISCFGQPLPKWNHIPTLAEVNAVSPDQVCDELDLAVDFPNCWDGVNLDSPDHTSHMLLHYGSGGCPASHPIAVPLITQNVHYGINKEDLPHYRLASDPPDQPAGWTLHADWWNGWAQDAPIPQLGNLSIDQILMKEVYGLNPDGSDARAAGIYSDNHANLLGSPAGDNQWWMVTTNGNELPPSSVFIPIASNGGTFSLKKTTVVRYGDRTSYNTATLQRGTYICGAATFGGDPAPSRAKVCSKGNGT